MAVTKRNKNKSPPENEVHFGGDVGEFQPQQKKVASRMSRSVRGPNKIAWRAESG